MKRKKEKKAQMKIQQMAFMLLAVFFFFMLVILFFFSLKYANLKKEATLLEENKALASVSKIAETAEFACSEGGSIKPYCVDTDKVMAFYMHKASYKKIFPFEIKSIYIYKLGEAKKECDISNYPDCSFFRVFEAKNENNIISVSSFVALCRKENDKYIYNKCELGKILIGFERK